MKSNAFICFHFSIIIEQYKDFLRLVTANFLKSIWIVHAVFGPETQHKNRGTWAVQAC